MHIIEVNNLIKKFDKKKVINNISFKVAESEIFGFLGPSGAGKTTLIKILSGQLKYDEGSIAIFATDPANINDNIYQNIGMVMEDFGLYERLTGYENLEVFAEIYKVNKIQIDETLKKVELFDSKNKLVSKYSKGMKQRLMIARSIIHSPKLLFLDEPTSGLDPATARKIHDLLFELQKRGTTIFLTTHNMEEATLLCNNVALIHLGNIVEYGSPEEICRKYNKNNIITILDSDYKIHEIKNSKTNAKKIASLFAEGKVISIHSSEPSLESVFIELTGKELI